MTDNCSAAIKYAKEYGWAVFPIKVDSKRPNTRNGFKDATNDVDQIEQWWTRHPNDGIGVAMGEASGGIFAIDVDCHEGQADGRDSLHEWEHEHGELPETVMSITGSGGAHYIYKYKQGDVVRCTGDVIPGVQIKGEGGYIVVAPSVHPNGNEYQWENDPCDFDIAPANAVVREFVAQSRQTESEPFSLPDEIDKGGRDETMFKYASSLQSKGMDDQDIISAVSDANRARCNPPLPDADIRRILNSVLKRYEKGNASANTTSGEAAAPNCSQGNAKTPHNVFGQWLIAEDHACSIDGAPAVWDGHRYDVGWSATNIAMLRHYDGMKMQTQREVRNYIMLKAPVLKASDSRLIAFKNGVWDMRAGELCDYTPDMVITNVIPHDIDPKAKCDAVDRVLNRMACGNVDVLNNLHEIIGVCMLRSSEFAQCPILLGNGSNGKSTYIKMLRAVLGDENVSSLDIGMMGKHFQASHLLGKLANLGDDISNEFLKGDVLAVFKKIASGDWIYTDVKNGEGFSFKPYCTLVFSANEFPRLGDSSDGMMRRLFPVSFDAHFSPNDADYNPRVIFDVTGEEACKRLCALGLMGLERVIAQNGFTQTEVSRHIVDEIRTDNNTVLQYIEDLQMKSKDFSGNPTNECYGRYASWCDNNGVKAKASKSFSKDIKTRFGLATKNVAIEGRHTRWCFCEMEAKSDSVISK